MTLKEKVNLAMAWYDSGLEDRAAFQTLMESILAQPAQRTEQEQKPAQRTWVGLTDEDVMEVWDKIKDGDWAIDFYDAVEAKLKEKNT